MDGQCMPDPVGIKEDPSTCPNFGDYAELCHFPKPGPARSCRGRPEGFKQAIGVDELLGFGVVVVVGIYDRI